MTNIRTIQSVAALNNAFAGSLTATAVKTSAYAAAAGDLIPVDATSGAVTVTLPTAPAARTRVAVKKIDASTNVVTVARGGSSDVFNKAGGSTSLTLTLTNQALSLQYSGGIWYVVGDDLPLGQLDVRYAARTSPLVSSLTYPLVIAHRGAANLFPEGTLVGYLNAASLGLQAIEAGDIQAASDGGLIDFHDGTVDRTTTASGNVTDFTTMGVKRLVADASSWFGGSWPDQEVSTFGEILGRAGGLCVVVPEVKDGVTTTASALFTMLRHRGLADSAIVQSFTYSCLTVAEATGIARMWLLGSIASMGSTTFAQVKADGIDFIAIDHLATGDLAGFVTSAHAAGLKTVAYTVDHQYDYDTVIALGFDCIFSNDPIYAPRNYTGYRTTSSKWHQNGTWGHGMGVINDGPFTASQRGSFVGVAGAYRWKAARNLLQVVGSVSPIVAAAGSYTITSKFVVDQVPTTTSQGLCLFPCTADDRAQVGSGNAKSSYLVKVRATGVINSWSIDSAGAATSLGAGLTTTAWAIPTLSSGLTAGVAVTSLPVNALTVAVKSGHQFMLPTGQIATASGAAAISATAIPVTSITPSAAVVSGASLLPYITIVIAVTPTTITVSRSDESTAGNIVYTNNLQRGAYLTFMDAIDVGDVSLHTVTIT